MANAVALLRSYCPKIGRFVREFFIIAKLRRKCLTSVASSVLLPTVSVLEQDAGVRAMTARFDETSDGLWIPFKSRIAGARGCMLIVAIPSLVAGIWLITIDYVLIGVLIIVAMVLGIISSFTALWPYGLAITPSYVRLEVRSFFRRASTEIPKKCWIELWLHRESDKEARVYLNTRSADLDPTKYAVLLYWGAPDDVEEVASRVTEFLGLRCIPALMSNTVKFSFSKALSVARQTRKEAEVQQADRGGDGDALDAKASIQQALARAAILRKFESVKFDSITNPEAWLMERASATLTHQTSEGRTEHSFDEVEAIEIDTVKEGVSKGEDAYGYEYTVHLVLQPGERFLLRTCTSVENGTTDKSNALREAKMFATYLRTTMGLSEP
jgi:hypothetical protein